MAIKKKVVVKKKGEEKGKGKFLPPWLMKAKEGKDNKKAKPKK